MATGSPDAVASGSDSHTAVALREYARALGFGEANSVSVPVPGLAGGLTLNLVHSLQLQTTDI